MKKNNIYRYSYSPSTSFNDSRDKPSIKKNHYKLKLGILAVGIVLGLFFISNIFDSNDEPKISAQKVSKKIINSNEMSQKINSVIANNSDMQVGVSIINLSDDKSYNYGVDNGFLAASTAKLLTATLYLHEVEQGKLTLNKLINGEKAQTEIGQMIEQSDNNAWYALNNILTHSALSNWASSIGLRNYNSEDNIITPSDVAVLLAKLYKNELLSHEHTQLLLGYMKNANESNYIVRSVNGGAKVYHKAGWLDDRVHDAAIIDNGKNPYVLVIFSKVNDGGYDSEAGQKMFADITKISQDTFADN